MADELTTWSLPAETKEYVGPIVVLADGVPTSAFDVCVTEGQARPSNWTLALALDGTRGVLVGAGTAYPLVAGRKYTVWTRFTDAPEIPVQRVGIIRAT